MDRWKSLTLRSNDGGTWSTEYHITESGPQMYAVNLQTSSTDQQDFNPLADNQRHILTQSPPADMACRGRLFLLLSSSLLLCSLSASEPSSQQENHHLQKRGKAAKTAFKAADYAVKIASVAKPFIGMIPVAGPIINGLIAIIKFGLDKSKPDPTEAVLKELENLNLVIKNYRTEQKWDTWASHYSEYEADIKVASNEFEALVKVLGDDGKTSEQKTNHIHLFKSKYKPIALSSKKLYLALTAQQPSFLTKFGKLVTDTFRCHEKDIKQLTLFISDLFYRGNTVDLFYNSIYETEKTDELVKSAFESAKVMFEIHKHCISDFITHVKNDVLDRIDEKKSRDQLAKDIRVFLDETYDRYNWITVAFLTKYSSHQNKFTKPQNKHMLSGFIEVPKGDVTVAVAGQVKGSHTKADKVRKALEKCLEKTVECEKLEEKLSQCSELVDGIKVNNTYTVIHAFISKSHDSFKALDAKEASGQEDSVEPESHSDIPYVYTGKCMKYKIFNLGQFRVLIKSDEEMMGLSPCNNMNCGEKGECKLITNTLIPVCECVDGFYGENCEESVEDYKKRMMEKMP
ncbi:hypothetical protein Q8A73_016788 [Channa argus]|nr:hypothetical protein Q8A73_016788 [Channa argus]